jgi:hypothetical protein
MISIYNSFNYIFFSIEKNHYFSTHLKFLKFLLLTDLLNFGEYIVITFRIGVLTDLFLYLEKKLYHFIESERMCSHITCEACV